MLLGALVAECGVALAIGDRRETKLRRNCSRPARLASLQRAVQPSSRSQADRVRISGWITADTIQFLTNYHTSVYSLDIKQCIRPC